MRNPLFLALATGYGLAVLALSGQVIPSRLPESADSILIPEPASADQQLEAVRRDWQMEGIDSAFRNGFISIARTLTDELLASSPTGETLETLLNYRLHIALISGNLLLARETQAALEAGGLSPDTLLSAFLAFFEGSDDLARQRLDRLDPAVMAPVRRAWYHLLQALLLAREGETEEANERFLLAERTAPSALLRDHFEIIRIRENLQTGSIDEEEISALRESVRSMKGERGGFEAARLLAVALDRSGQPAAAIEVLNNHLALPGLREFGLRPDFLLLIGMIAGPESPRGQLALRQLISEAEDIESGGVALSLLAQAMGNGYAPDAFLEDLNRWLEREVPHPLTDRMLAYKAYLQMEKRLYSAAEDTAMELIERFPNSPHVPVALRLLAYSSWNQTPPRYRTAADYLNQLRERLGAGADTLRIGVLIADCYFLNADYTSASDAYGAVLGDARGEMAATVFFQRILSELGADNPELAAEHIDDSYADPRIPLNVIWMAEWNLLDYLRRAERVSEAFARIERLLDTDTPQPFVPPELRLRMEWVAARLSLEVGQPGLAVERADALLRQFENPPYDGLPESLLEAVKSHLLLLIGEARLQLGETESGMETFRSLRTQYARSGPAILSYLVESRQESDADNLVSAQQSLISLVDRFPASEYAPIALWEAALNAEQRGLNVHLQEAISILERLVTEYPSHGLVYYARLKQGDLARRLNDFPTALLLYERLLAQYPDHPERYRAELSRADCLMALGSEDPSRYDAAAVIYERNCLLSSAPNPVRLEAGYKWAHSLIQQGDRAGAQGVLWLLYERFILDPDLNQSILVEEAGRYWMSRIILELGSREVEAGETAAALRIFETIIRFGLPGVATARARIETLQ